MALQLIHELKRIKRGLPYTISGNQSGISVQYGRNVRMTLLYTFLSCRKRIALCSCGSIVRPDIQSLPISHKICITQHADTGFYYIGSLRRAVIEHIMIRVRKIPLNNVYLRNLEIFLFHRVPD